MQYFHCGRLDLPIVIESQGCDSFLDIRGFSGYKARFRQVPAARISDGFTPTTGTVPPTGGEFCLVGRQENIYEFKLW